MPAAVQDADVGNIRRCATKQRMASRARSEALLRIESRLRRHPPNKKVLELCMAGSTNCPRLHNADPHNADSHHICRRNVTRCRLDDSGYVEVVAP